MSTRHLVLLSGLALAFPWIAWGAQGPSYGCPLTAPATVAGPSRLGGGGWVTEGGFDDRRPVGIDAQRNRTLVPHGALDLAARRGVPVLAVREGRVIASGVLPHLGATVLVAHADRSMALYALLGATRVPPGASIRRGAVLATAGFSGDGVPLARRSAVQPRVHLALLVPRRANAGAALWTALWAALGGAPDAWVAALDSLAAPRDPRTLLPHACFTR